jgi:integrase
MAKGYVRQLKSGSWELIFDLPRDPGQRRKQKSVTVKAANKKEAEKKLREMLTSIDQNTYTDPGNMTLGEYLQKWLDNFILLNRRQTTVDGYTVIIEKHLIPALGRIKLSKLQPVHIQGYYTQALLSGCKDSRRKDKSLSTTTVRHHHALLHRVLQTAYKQRLISYNPCDLVEAPKMGKYRAKVYDEADVARLIEAAEGTLLYIPVIITLATGLRRGEVLGLRWPDFDQKAKTITIDESLLDTSKGPLFDEVKTETSWAVLDIPESIAQELIAHKHQQERAKTEAGELWLDEDLICCREDGRRWHPGTFSDAFARLLKKHGLPHIRFHDLRHTHASHLIRMGFHPKVVCERLRHSRIGTTMDIYGHLFPGVQREVAEKLDEKLFSKVKNHLTKHPT